jgi:hypothetical protein
MAGAACVCNLAILTWPIENSEVTCGLRPWFWTVPFYFLLNILIAKSWRIIRIFDSEQLRVARAINDASVLVQALALCAPQLLINIIWSALDSPGTSLLVPNALTPATNRTDCAGAHTSAFVGVSLAYAALLLLAACYCALRIRKASELFNDSRAIATALYSFALIVVLVAALQLALGGGAAQLETLFIIRSIGVLFAVQALQGTLVADRLHRAHLEASANGSGSGGIGGTSALDPAKRRAQRLEHQAKLYSALNQWIRTTHPEIAPPTQEELAALVPVDEPGGVTSGFQRRGTAGTVVVVANRKQSIGSMGAPHKASDGSETMSPPATGLLAGRGLGSGGSRASPIDRPRTNYAVPTPPPDALASPSSPQRSLPGTVE